jgi:hypothetical protein
MADAGRAVVTFVGDYKQLQAGLASTLAPAKLGKMGKLGGAAAGGALAAGIGGAVLTKALYDLGAKFDKAQDKIRVGTGKTGKQLRALENDLKSVYSRTPADLDMVAEAVVGISQRLELTGKPMRRFALNMVELSRITGTDVGENVANVTKLFGDFSVKTNDQVEALNKLYRAGQQSGVSVADLADNMKKFGSPLRALGMDFDTTAAMFAKFDAEGVNLQSAIPGLRRALKEFGEAGKEPKKALADVFAEIRKAPTDLKAMTIGFETFGTKAGPDMAMAVREGRFNLKGFIAEMRGGNDTILEGARATNDAGENLAKVWHRIEVAIAPAAEFIFETFGKITAWLAGPEGAKAFQAFGRIVRTTFEGIKRAVMPLVNTIRTGFKVIKSIVEAVSRFINTDAKNLWKSVTRNWQNGVGGIKRIAGNIWSSIKGALSTVKNGMVGVFESAWNRVEGVFKAGANAVIGVVNAIISAINLIPGVPDIGKIDKIGGGGKGWQNAGTFQRGGMLHGGAPSGDSIPAMLERGEYVLNRNAVAEVGVDKLDALNFKKASRFQTGGRVGMIGGGAIDLVTDAAGAVANAVGNVVGKAASFFIDKLPKPDIPEPFTGVGPYLIDKVTDWMKDKVPTPSSGGSFSYSGPPADMRKLGDNAWVDSHTLAVGDYLAKRFNTEITDGWRPQDAGYGAANSSHKRGTPSNPGALDFAAATTEFQAFVGAHVAGVTENLLNDDYSTGPHNHVAFFRKGGLVGKIARMMRGGSSNKIPGVFDIWNNDQLASLAHAVGMKGPGYMAQIANGESSGNPREVGNDPGSTFGYGLWQITSGYHDDLIAAAGGVNNKGIFDPMKNAKAAKHILDTEGLGAWYADPRGPKGKVIGWLSRALRGKGGSGAGGGKPAKPWLDASGGYAPGSGGPKGQKEQGQKMSEAFRKAAAIKRKRITAKIAGADRFPFRDDLKSNGGLLARVAETIGIAETTASGDYSPGQSELTDTELDEQVRLYKRQLKLQEKRKRIVEKAIKHMVGVRDYLAGMVAKASKKGSPLRWKLGAFRTALGNVKGILDQTLIPDLQNLVGVTGKGGEIFATNTRLNELGVTTTSEDTRNGELLALMREQLNTANRSNAILTAQMPVFQQFMPRYHTGGVIPGSGEVPIMAQAGEGVFTRDQMAAMGTSSPQNITVVIEDGAVDSSRIRVEVDGVLAKHISEARRSTGGRKFATNG